MGRVGSRGIALVALLLVGCGTGAVTTERLDATAPPASALGLPSSAASPSASPAPAYEEVEFGAAGGPTLRGRLWPGGPVGVVLAHGHSPSTGQDDWDSPGCDPRLCGDQPAFGAYLAGLGYGVLTFDFHSFCDRGGCSEGMYSLAENWRDVVAAVDYLRFRGSERIFVVGASMGGIDTFRAADEAELELAGIVSLATPQFPSIYYPYQEPSENDVSPARLRRIATTKLFIAGADDWQYPADGLHSSVGSLNFASEARAMFEASAEPRQLEIVDSDRHSSELVVSAGREVVEHARELIVAFIEEHA